MVTFNARALDEICRRHDVQRLRMFGSAVQGQAGPDSDVDLLVDFRSRKTFIEVEELAEELENLLGREVDLLTEKSLSPYVRDSVLGQARVIYGPAG